MSKPDSLKIQTCILKVNIHCDGCEQKVKKLLQKIDGVYSVSIDPEQGKVIVLGHVDPATLIKKLKRSGKHAEIWGGQRGVTYSQNNPTNHQFRNLQVDNGKVGKDNKSQNHKGEKRGGGGQPANFQNMKGAKDLKEPAKDQKSVKFNLPEEEFDASDDGFDELEDHDLDDYDDEDGEEGYGHAHHGHPMHNKMMMIGPPMNKPKGNGGGGGNYGNAKKGDVIDIPVHTKGKGGNYEGKNGNGEKKSNGDGGKNNKGGKQKGKGGGGGDSNNNNKNKNKNTKSGGGGGGLLGWFLGFGKKSKNGGGGADTKNKNSGGGNSKGKEGKKGGGKLQGHSDNTSKMDFDFQDFDIPPHDKNGKGGKGRNNGKGNAGLMGPMSQKGPMGQTGSITMDNHYPMDQMSNIQAVQGLPAAAAMNGGGYYQGMQMQPPPYNLQQQQYMAMMMNQQQHQANMNNMYPPHMMYERPHPSMNYMPPPPMPSHPMADPITHVFSDENTESCVIM